MGLLLHPYSLRPVLQLQSLRLQMVHQPAQVHLSLHLAVNFPQLPPPHVLHLLRLQLCSPRRLIQAHSGPYSIQPRFIRLQPIGQSFQFHPSA